MSTYLTDVAKRLMDSDTPLVCWASCCHWVGSFAFTIKLFEHSTIRQAPSTTFRVADKIGSCNCRPYEQYRMNHSNNRLHHTVTLIDAGTPANSLDMAYV